MQPDPSRRFELDLERLPFAPERPTADLGYALVRCDCENRVFHVTGWPRVVAGRGGFFWRTLTRVWREARQTTADGEWIESHFALPLLIQCRACGTDETLFDEDLVPDRLDAAGRSAPREAYRCRACGRGLFEIVAGRSPAEPRRPADVVEVHVRCDRCRQQARVASSVRPDAERRARLDLLYGRR